MPTVDRGDGSQTIFSGVRDRRELTAGSVKRLSRAGSKLDEQGRATSLLVVLLGRGAAADGQPQLAGLQPQRLPGDPEQPSGLDLVAAGVPQGQLHEEAVQMLM